MSRAGYVSRMTTPHQNDQPDETPGGSTITDPEAFNGAEGADGSGDTDNTDDDLDAPDPS